MARVKRSRSPIILARLGQEKLDKLQKRFRFDEPVTVSIVRNKKVTRAFIEGVHTHRQVAVDIKQRSSAKPIHAPGLSGRRRRGGFVIRYRDIAKGIVSEDKGTLGGGPKLK